MQNKREPEAVVVSNKNLRNKLAKRLKILNEDLVKNGKNIGKLIESNNKSDDNEGTKLLEA